MEIEDRQTDVTEDRNVYEIAACMLTAADTIPPEENDENTDIEGTW